MSASWAGGSTRAWRTLRAAVLRRARYRCQVRIDGRTVCPRHRVPCPAVCTVRAELTGRHRGHAHHTRGRGVTGDDPRYIVASCAPCNLHVGDPSEYTDPPNVGVTRW